MVAEDGSAGVTGAVSEPNAAGAASGTRLSPQQRTTVRLGNLLCLLAHSGEPVTRAEIFQRIPEYGNAKSADAAVKMFERDKNVLRAIGARVESHAEQGDNKLTRYSVPREEAAASAAQFSDAELVLLHAAAQVWQDAGLRDEARNADLKILGMLEAQGAHGLAASQRLGAVEECFHPLWEAIEAGVCVTFPYTVPERDAALQREVAPLQLVLIAKGWHLIGWDLEREAVRVFLLERVSGEVRRLKTRVTPEHRGWTRRSVQDLVRYGQSRPAVVAVREGSAAQRVLAPRARAVADGAAAGGAVAGGAGNTGGAGGAAASAIPAGYVSLSLPLYDARVFARELAGFAADVRVLEPAELRDAVIAVMRAVYDQHAPAAGVSAGGDKAIGESAAGASATAETAPAVQAADFTSHEEPAAATPAVAAASEQKTAEPSAAEDALPQQKRFPRQSVPNTPERLALMLAIVNILQLEREVAVTELAQRLGATPEDIRAIAHLLVEVGVPDEFGDPSIDASFMIDLDELAESDTLVYQGSDTLEFVPAFTAGEVEALVSGLEVVRAGLPEGEGAQIAALLARLRPAEKESAITLTTTENAVDAELAQLCRAACQRGEVLLFNYRDLQGRESARQVLPLQVWSDGERQFLRAYCFTRHAERNFWLAQMGEVRVRAAAPAEVAEVAVWREQHPGEDAAMAGAGGPAYTLVANVSPAAWQRITGFAPERHARLADGTLQVRIAAWNENTPVRLVSVLPGQIEVVRPVAARRAVAEFYAGQLAAWE